MKQLARLAGWQDTLTKLYVKESYESRQHSLSLSSSGGCLELLRLSEPPGRDGGTETGGKEAGGCTSPPPAELQELDVFLPLGYEALDQELSEGFSDHSTSPSGRTKSFHSYNFKSFDSSDRASRSSSNPGDVPFDGVYHPLSPFSTSPFDLGLDLASTSSIATAESGAQTPASGPGTPSPLESFKPFPGMRTRKSSSLSNVLDESSYQDALPSDNVSNTSNPQVSLEPCRPPPFRKFQLGFLNIFSTFPAANARGGAVQPPDQHRLLGDVARGGRLGRRGVEGARAGFLRPHQAGHGLRAGEAPRRDQAQVCGGLRRVKVGATGWWGPYRAPRCPAACWR